MGFDVTLEGCVAVRVRIGQVGPAQISKEHGGIICIGARTRNGLAPLIAICDEGSENSGASATNSVDALLGWLRHEWKSFMDVEDANVVELDSERSWDHVHAAWEETGMPEVNWSPIRWPMQQSRSEGALTGAFGDQAKRVLGTLDYMIGTGEMSFKG